MKIVTSHQSNPEIEIIEIHGELAGRGAVKLADFLYSSLDEGKRYMIMNLKHVKRADGLGLNVLEYFISRGVKIRLFNVGLEIQSMLSMSRKDRVIRTYNCQEQEEALSLFKEEIMAEQDSAKGKVIGRRFNRVNVSFQAKFKYVNVKNDEITFKAVIRNLSEGGILTEQITAFKRRTGERPGQFQMAGKEFCDIMFSLNGSSRRIEADGECVWETMEYGDHYAGINFKDMNQSHREMIRKYVHEQECI